MKRLLVVLVTFVSLGLFARMTCAQHDVVLHVNHFRAVFPPMALDRVVQRVLHITSLQNYQPSE